MRAGLPSYLRAMVRRSPPAQAPVVAGSTPVIAFGDPSRAEIASLGINPSKREFVETSAMLAGDQRRLATLDSLGADHLASLTDEQVREVVDDCARYFQRNPYRQWFDPLDHLLRDALGASFHDGSAWCSGRRTRSGARSATALCVSCSSTTGWPTCGSSCA